MKRLLLLSFALLTAGFSFSQIQMPAPSPHQTIVQDFGVGKITLDYSRPSLRNRTVFKENSDLAPLGKMWRTGANMATKIHFSDVVTIGGKNIDTGSYAIYTIPGKGEWAIILNKGFNNPGIEGYEQNLDVVRFTAPAKNVNPAAETFTMQFADVQPERCQLVLHWGNTMVNFPIITNVKDKVKAQIDAALKGDKKPYWQAANYYYEWQKDYPKALEYVNNAISENKEAFYMYMLKARIEKELGDKSAAKSTADKVIELAKKVKNDDYVRMAEAFKKTL